MNQNNEVLIYRKPKRPNVLFWGIKKNFKKIQNVIGCNPRVNEKRFLKYPWIKNKFYKYLLKNKKFKCYINPELKNSIRLISETRIQFLIKINCYKGSRHSSCLSVRGQRTKTNCKTQRKKKKKINARNALRKQKKRENKKKKKTNSN